MADVDCVVLGAGVVGLAVSRALAQHGNEVLLVEAAEGIGTGTSSRNSEVIHAGIYYAPGSLKAALCVAGRPKLYAYCAERGIPHRRIGKFIVSASAEQTQKLKHIAERARRNGVDDLYWLSGTQARAVEPELTCEMALVSPSTGIIDSHALMLALQADAERSGTQCVFHTPFLGGRILASGEFLLSFGGAQPMELTATRLVNATGLRAPATARSLSGLPKEAVPQAYFCKGSYFALSHKAPFSHLIYPMPDEAGLGVHFTLDMGGQAKFGPDTEWIDGEDYAVDAARGESFYASVRTYWPGLPDAALIPGYSGIRPKVTGPDSEAADFIISGPAMHGVDNLVNLFGIESPGLTACLSIAEAVEAALCTSVRGA